ncbi:MAG: hypothetical protein A2381_14935 [Bdellovibrionales bacterium RIFOXYB1_FULL_37_110]|nr:MAG: hypothetical protein A2417_10440 [Bdellovibrionales bacterium RIFOXYC1_FULL_37_79]OFZ60160.1 MAG: hypothetical protein A2381_14935 [Bdellovibrionales bacterium RIFOXYB1_FULL_37_110]OFZ64346.1 MAG: hypothetical protein A2577_09835 [Bdellovibrionales bacterium RIFOXYD1_FULL_36_51]
MILRKDFEVKLVKFGIHIPLDERMDVILDHLTSHYSDNIFYKGNFRGEGLTKDDLLLAHTKDYVEALLGDNLVEIMGICFELDEYGDKPTTLEFRQLRDLILREAFYTYQGMQLALQQGFCYFLGGGMHHAMSFAGRGFCLINDLVIGARKLMAENLIKKVWIIDVDAHKGDGTSEMSYQDARFFTLSMHMKKGWPLLGKNNNDPEMIPSNVDIPVDFREEENYQEKLEAGLLQLAKLDPLGPDLAVVVNGADPYEYDELPGTAGIKLTKSQMFFRDQMIYRFLQGKHIPMLFVMGGGYGKKVGEVYIQFLDWLLKQRSCE